MQLDDVIWKDPYRIDVDGERAELLPNFCVRFLQLILYSARSW